MIHIKDYEMISEDNLTVIQAKINEFRLFFKIPSEYNIQPSGDPFLSAVFFPAMLKGESVIIDKNMKISAQLATGIKKLQEIFQCWYPKLSAFEVSCETTESLQISGKVASFFSGGIDSLYTAIKNKSDIDYLIYVNGFDFEMPPKVFENGIRRLKKTAEYLDKKLIPIETNLYSFMKQDNINRVMNQGSCLASIGQLIGVSKVYIPSSHTYNDLHPNGSHPLTDRLWSTEATKFVHDGAEAMRTEKTNFIFTPDNGLADNLIVCWEYPYSNCGKCPKCQRTMTTLKILGIKSSSFPSEISIKSIQKTWIGGSIDLVYIKENLKLAREYGKKDIVKALKKALIRSKLRFFKYKTVDFLKNSQAFIDKAFL